MKKANLYLGLTLSAFLIVVFMMLIFNTSIKCAKAISYEESDAVFIETVQDLLGDNYLGSNIDIVANKEIVYDINLKELGVLYNFIIENQSGYAIVLNRFGFYEVEELFFDAKNPYINIEDDSYRIFVCPLTYITYTNGEYYSENKEIISNDVLDNLCSKAYGSNGYAITFSYETINFISRNENGYELAKRLPSNRETSNLKNDCVPVAGANIIQYWDRYAVNLIPDFTPGAGSNKNYFYKEKSAQVIDVTTQLYEYMESTETGTKIDNFKKGMITYTNRQGYNIEFKSSMVSKKFNYDIAKSIFLKDQPMILFVDVCTTTTMENSSNSVRLENMTINGAHAMVAFGYKEIEYNLTNGKRIDYYLRVATGLSQRPNGYLNVNDVGMIDDAYGVIIK